MPACLYKSDTGRVDEILDTDITITLIREQRPIKLLGQLGSKYTVAEKGKGIYQIEGMLFPMQITCYTAIVAPCSKHVPLLPGLHTIRMLHAILVFRQPCHLVQQLYHTRQKY